MSARDLADKVLGEAEAKCATKDAIHGEGTYLTPYLKRAPSAEQLLSAWKKQGWCTDE